MLKLTALREILRYVPNFRDQTFVVAVDGEIVEHEPFQNVLVDVALMRSLNIRVVLVHGAGWQIRRAAEQAGLAITNSDGTGVTDAATLRLAMDVSARITHEILEGLSAADLRGACTNAIVAHPAGILRGVDMQWLGKIDRIDTEFLMLLLERGIVPVIQPLGYDGEGHTYRVNSDAIAAQLARSLKAIKLIFLSSRDGIERDGRLIRSLSVTEAGDVLKLHRDALVPDMVSKLEHAWRACQGGVDRVHIINGRVDEGLLSEVFSSDGVGTLIYMNAYQSIRRAEKRDARAIFKMIGPGVENDELLKRSRAAIEKQIDDYYIFEIDGNPAGCVALHAYPDLGKGELASLYVSTNHENRGVGRKLMNFVEQRARELGLRELLTLSTQAFTYFQQKGGYAEATPEDLPPLRRQQWEQSKRNSRVLKKVLQ